MSRNMKNMVSMLMNTWVCLWLLKERLRSIKVATVIEFMKKEGRFPFWAIRAEGRNSKKLFGNIDLYFDEKGAYYQPILPKVQMCLIDFNKFHIADFKFVK